MYFLELTVSQKLFLKDIFLHYSNFIDQCQKSISGFMKFDTSNVSIINDSLIFHSIFPIFRAQKFSKRFLSCFFESFSEIQFGYNSRKERNLFFLGKIFKKKNNLTLYPIKNFKKSELIKSDSKNHLKNLTYFYKHDDTEKEKKFSLGKKKKLFKENKFISFFKRFSRVSIGNQDHLFNVKFNFRPKIFNFYRIIRSKKNLNTDFDLKKIVGLLKKLSIFSMKSIGQRFDFIICDYIANKNYLKKAFFFFFFSLGFFPKKDFFISHSFFEKDFQKNFHFSDSFFDFSSQFFLENGGKKKTSFPFFLGSRIEFQTNLFPRSNCNTIYQDMYFYLKKNCQKRKKNKKLLDIVKKNFYLWLKRKGYSEFKSNIFIFKLGKKNKKLKNNPLFHNLFNNLEVFIIFSMEKRSFRNILKVKNFFKNSKKVLFTKMFTSIIMKFNNFDIDFKNLKFGKYKF
jgi:hypothetical protein